MDDPERRALRRLRAFRNREGSEAIYDTDEMFEKNAMNSLEQMGYAECVSSSFYSTGWQITDIGLKRLAQDDKRV